MTGPLPNPPRLLDWRTQGPQAVALGGLMVASALTEGVGLVLLVPILSLFGAGGSDGASGRIASLLAAIGIPTALAPLLALFVVLVSLRAVLNHVRAMAALRLQVDAVDALRRRTLAALVHCDWRTLVSMRQSDNASLLISSVGRVGIGIGQAVIALSALVTLGGLGLAGLAISAPVTLATGLAGATVLFAYRGMRRRATRIGERLTVAAARVHGSLGEGLGALRVIKSFGREAEAQRAASDDLLALREAQLAYQRDSGLGQIALQAGGAAVLALVVWLAMSVWRIGPATILPLVALFARVLPLLGALQDAWQHWAHSRPAAEQALALIARAEAAREPGDDVPASAIAPPQRDIVLERVEVRFPGRENAVLEGIDLTIPARGITALLGPSGAGKSTIADLLGGLIAPDAGTIRIDGAALDGTARRAWRHRVAYVQQEAVLFSGTIRENLLWADPAATEARMLAALAQASAKFVSALPKGLDTAIGDGGRQFSGGERQRLVLARALLRDPALLILDEATSALDSANEEAIAAVLDSLRERLAVVVICHRGILAEIADQRVMVQGGRIVSIE